MVKISRWQPPTNKLPVRYYLAGFNVTPSDAKFWLEFSKSGEPQVKSTGIKFPCIDEVLDRLLADLLITHEDKNNPSPKLFDELSSVVRTKSASLPSLSPTVTTVSQLHILAPISLDKPVTILVDHREPPEIFAAFSKINGLTVEKTVLNSGDFAFHGGVIERKSAFDFTQSIVDKRLFFQSDEISSMDSKVLRAVILEGDIYAINRLNPNALDGAVSYLAVLQGISVINSTSAQHTANLVARFAYHSVHGLGYEISYRQAKPKNVQDQILNIIQGVPGIGVETGKSFLNHFGSLSRFFNASVNELQAIEGIGKKTAQKIYDVLHQEWQK